MTLVAQKIKAVNLDRQHVVVVYYAKPHLLLSPENYSKVYLQLHCIGQQSKMPAQEIQQR